MSGRKSGRAGGRPNRNTAKRGGSGQKRSDGADGSFDAGPGRQASRAPGSKAGRRAGPSGPDQRRSGPRRKSSRGLGGDQVEGRQAVRELLLAGRRSVREVLMIDDLAESDVLGDIEELSNELGVVLRKVTRRHLANEALTESHQGVIARAAPLQEADFDQLMADPKAFLLVLDGITDPGNVGAILRTAECAGVTGVVLGRHRSAHITPTVTKTAAGAVEHVPLTLVGGIPAALQKLNDAGVLTVGLDGGSETSLYEIPGLGDGPVALVLGAEGTGMTRLARQRVAALASIPLGGNLNSLNVGTASAVACFEVVRLRVHPAS